MTRTLHEKAMTRTLRTLDCTLCEHPDPHDKSRETDILETKTINPGSPEHPTPTPVRSEQEVAWKLNATLESQRCAIMKINQSKDWDAEKLHVDATVHGRQPAQAGT